VPVRSWRGSRCYGRLILNMRARTLPLQTPCLYGGIALRFTAISIVTGERDFLVPAARAPHATVVDGSTGGTANIGRAIVPRGRR